MLWDRVVIGGGGGGGGEARGLFTGAGFYVLWFVTFVC